MSAIPRAVLSDRFQEAMEGRRMLCAVFLTFRFDPAFFEQEILPIFFDVPLSHATAIKLVQMEDTLRGFPGQIAVYYDQNGLQAQAGSSKLDIRRVPVRHPTGIFHPKNVFVLTEDIEPDDQGYHARSLIAASLSANLTRAGWWENVEACHIETIEEGDFTRLRDDLRSFLGRLSSRSADRQAGDANSAIDAIRRFLLTTSQRQTRTTGGTLHTHFFHKQTRVSDFIHDTTANAINDLYLEVISPYLDDAGDLAPLRELIDTFNPREVRIFLPRSDSGEALCSADAYSWVAAQPNVSWGRLPKELLALGKGEKVRQRTVHAKVYRFFSMSPKREYFLIGSVNLTSPAFQRGGNLETAFLVQADPARRPDWWMESDRSKPGDFKPRSEDEGVASEGGTRLSLAYWWNTGVAKAHWDADEASPKLAVEAGGIPLFAVENLAGRQWTDLDADASTELGIHLKSSSIVQVRGEGKEPALLLIQEEGMSHRPSLLLDLSPADILRYWSLLTPEQRAAFIEVNSGALATLGEGLELITGYAVKPQHDTLFDRFAGVFHAFGCVERAARDSLRNKQEREATYRLFGQKYDSLGTLLTRVQKDADDAKGDLVEQYMIALCAQQLLKEFSGDFPEFWAAHPDDAARLHGQIESLRTLRERIIARNDADMPAFVDWFERWFLRRATPVEKATS